MHSPSRAYTRVALLIAASFALALAHAATQDATQDTPPSDVPASTTPAPTTPAPTTPAPAATPEPIAATLILIREARELDLRPKNDEGMVMQSGGGPGLYLSMSLSLPEGAKVSAISQPKDLKATDNAGTDLSKIEPNFDDEREWITVEQWFDDPPTLDVKLAQPPRTAQTFSASFTANLTTYSGIDQIELDLIRKWTPLTHPSLAALKAEYRITSRGNFEVRPVTARELIEGVIALTEEAAEITESPGHSVSWDDKTAEFSVDPAPEEGQKLRVWVRANVQNTPIRVDIKDQKLP